MRAILRAVAYFLSVNLLHCLCSLCVAPTSVFLSRNKEFLNLTSWLLQSSEGGGQGGGGGGGGSGLEGKRGDKRRKAVDSVCEPVWPSGKALGWYAEGTRFESASALLSLQKVWSVDTVLWLCPSQL